MNAPRSLIVAAGVIVLGAQTVWAQDMSRYRDYRLLSSVDTVMAATGSRPNEVKTLHARPSSVQELQWRLPYLAEGADPVRDIVFRFLDDALYQVVVTYDRDRTEGLTDADVAASVSETYGVALATAGRRILAPPETFPESTVLAQWADADTQVTLVRGIYMPEFQLVLTSKALNTRAVAAIRQASQMDAVEAPRREAEQRRTDASKASALKAKARAANKVGFKP